MFKSKSIGIHFLRGLSGFCLLATAILGQLPVWVTILLAICGVLILRGCPMCWAIGLIEIVLDKIGVRKPQDLSCNLPAPPSHPTPPSRKTDTFFVP
jgi:hypothetical protein